MLISLAYCLVCLSHCSIFIFSLPAHLLDIEVAVIYFMMATKMSNNQHPVFPSFALYSVRKQLENLDRKETTNNIPFTL